MAKQRAGSAGGDGGAGGDLGDLRLELFTEGEKNLFVLWEGFGQAQQCRGALKLEHRRQLIDECFSLSIQGGNTHAGGILQARELIDGRQIELFHCGLLVGEMREELLVLGDELLKNELKLGDFFLHYFARSVLLL